MFKSKYENQHFCLFLGFGVKLMSTFVSIKSS